MYVYIYACVYTVLTSGRNDILTNSLPGGSKGVALINLPPILRPPIGASAGRSSALTYLILIL